MTIKNFIVFMLSCLSSSIYSQDCLTPDATTSDFESIPWYGDESSYTTLERMYDSLINIYGTNTTLRGYEDRMLLRVPLKFWLYRNGPGIPGGPNGDVLPTERRLQFAVDRLNGTFRDNGIAIRFFVHEVDTVEDALGVQMDSYLERFAYATLESGHYTFTKLNVHVVDEGGGFAEPGYDAVFVERGQFDEFLNSTLTHEIGHYFGLLHTFNFSEIPCFREPVSRGLKPSVCPPFIPLKRCVFTGDLLCDTDADPNMSDNGTYNTNCTWNANGLQDTYGDTYNPDPENFMAYNDLNDGCRSNFSRGQKMWMVVWAFKFKNAVQKGWLPRNNDQFDIYEPDNEAIAARTIFPGQTQEHTFHKKGRNDVDWVVFTAPACGLTKPVTFTVTNRTSNAVDEVAFFERAPGGNEGPELTATENNGTFTLSSGNLVCSSNTLFSIPSRPAGSTISWTKGSGIQYVSGQSTNAYTVKASSTASNSSWIQATKITMARVLHFLEKTYGLESLPGFRLMIPRGPLV